MTNRLIANLTRLRYLGLLLSLLLTGYCVWLLASHGLQLGLDFTGGSLLEFRIDTLRSAQDLNALLTPPLKGAIELHSAGAPGEWLIKLPDHALAWSPQELGTLLAEQLGVPVELLRT
ncbi:protein-export membrane protein SecF, partial [Aeromonas diversa CDC 2478-85]